MTAENRIEIDDLWKWVESGLLQYRASNPRPEETAEFLLGEIYRLGHNLNVDGASMKATMHFKAAIAINPASSKYHLQLGRHLTFINETAEEGQRELLLAVALDPHGAGDLPLHTLAYNFYLQQQFALAATFADRYLAIHPGDPGIKLISEASKKAVAGGPPPKILTVPVP